MANVRRLHGHHGGQWYGHYLLRWYSIAFIALTLTWKVEGFDCDVTMTAEECCDMRTHRCSLIYEAAQEYHQQYIQQHQQQHRPDSQTKVHLKRSNRPPLSSDGYHRSPQSDNRPVTDGRLHNRQVSSDSCIPHRTYLHCLRNFTCIGSIHYHVAVRGIERKMVDDGCKTNGTIYHPRPSTLRTAGVAHQCSYYRESTSPRHGYCALYGDPHLRTLDGRHQTCGMYGAWPLLDNKHLTVQVTSDRINNDDETTRRVSAVTKVTVLLKRNDECADHRYVTYEASPDWLPPMFTDGRSQVQSVTITEHEPNAYVEIHVPYIDTRILIRQVGGYLSVAVRIPMSIINDTSSSSSSSSDDGLADPSESLQLCVSGCPASQTVKHLVSSKHVRLKSGFTNTDQSSDSLVSSMAICRRAGVVDEFFDSCVFDLVATGNEMFANSSALAFADMLTFMPSLTSQLKNRTTLSLTWPHRSAVTTATAQLTTASITSRAALQSPCYVLYLVISLLSFLFVCSRRYCIQ